jgi:hypothetical protein
LTRFPPTRTSRRDTGPADCAAAFPKALRPISAPAAPVAKLPAKSWTNSRRFRMIFSLE